MCGVERGVMGVERVSWAKEAAICLDGATDDDAEG
jgi:hypothetical protein